MNLLRSLFHSSSSNTRREIQNRIKSELEFIYEIDYEGDIKISWNDESDSFVAFFDSESDRIADPASTAAVDQIRVYHYMPIMAGYSYVKVLELLNEFNKGTTVQFYLANTKRPDEALSLEESLQAEACCIVLACYFFELSRSPLSAIMSCLSWALNTQASASLEISTRLKELT